MQKTIRFKIVFRVLLIVIIGFGIVTVVVGQMFMDVLKENVLSAESFRLQQYMQYIEYMQESTKYYGERLAVDKEFQAIYESENEEEARWESVKNIKLREFLREYLLQRNDCTRIDVVFPDGNYYSSYGKEDENYYLKEYYSKFKQENAVKGFAGVCDVELYGISPKKVQRSIVYILSTRYIENLSMESIDIVLFIDAENFLGDFEIENSSVIAFTLLDNDGENLIKKGEFSEAAEEKLEDGMRAGKVTCTNGNTLIIVTDDKEDWIAIAEVSCALLLHQIKTPLIVIGGIMVLDCIALGVTLLLMILRILRPIKVLKEASKAIGEGNFQVRPQINTGDDFEELGNAYIQMQENLQNYMNRILKYEQIKKDMEIDKLVLQINPHFIYNTLNVISYMAEEEGNTQIEQFTNAFIALLQDSLAVSKGTYFTTLRQEIINLQNYTTLQQIRYEDKFELDIWVPKELMDCCVPNILLQPIVENSIFHGLLAKGEKGHIVVTAANFGENLYITIADDGVGMRPEVIEELLSEKHLVADSMRKIGTGNVKKRIEYIYGEAYGISIHSEVNRGTEVVLKLPCKYEHKTEEVF